MLTNADGITLPPEYAGAVLAFLWGLTLGAPEEELIELIAGDDDELDFILSDVKVFEWEYRG